MPNILRSLFLTVGSILSCPLALAQGPQVDAPDATYVGNQTSTGRQFLGIPYAQPPTGELRWQAPRPIEAKASEIKAQAFGGICVQPQNGGHFVPARDEPFTGQEDCLFLNVYTPADLKPGKPVMAWIHGGGYASGAGSSYDAHALAENNNLLVVTFNYRLGAMGFLSLPELGDASGNFAILDQQMALQWVQRNIAAFGGNPENVTVFGESAGGNSVCTQLLSPGSKGLYQRAIIQSGACSAEVRIYSRKEADQAGIDTAKAADCAGTDRLQCMRNLPPFTAATLPSALKSLGMVPWAPIAGTAVVPEDARAFASGNFNHVPVLHGSNRDEGRMFALFAQQQNQARTPETYAVAVRRAFEKKAGKILKKYPAAKYESPLMAYAAFMTDSTFSCPALSLSRAAARHTQVFAYEFSDQNAPIEAPTTPELPTYGAFHAAEMQYIFQTDLGFTNPIHFTAAQKVLANQMTQAWVNFARTGVPTIQGQVPWPEFKNSPRQLKNFNTTGPEFAADFEVFHQCDFWTSLQGNL